MKILPERLSVRVAYALKFAGMDVIRRNKCVPVNCTGERERCGNVDVPAISGKFA